MTMTALKYIQGKGIEHKKQGGEIVLRDCPFCGDTKSHFYIQSGEDGLFFCHKCQEKGNLITLKKQFGDYEPGRDPGNGTESHPRKLYGSVRQAFPGNEGQGKAIDEKIILKAHERLLGDAEAMSYLEARKITLETIKALRLGIFPRDALAGMGIKTEQDQKKWLGIPHLFNGKFANIKFRTLPPAEKNFQS